MSTDEYTPTADEVADAYTQWRVRQLGITDPDQRILASIDALTEFERWQEAQRADAEVAERIAQAIETRADSSPTYSDGLRRAAPDRARGGTSMSVIQFPEVERCECGSAQGPFVLDRDYCTLCPACAEDSRLCMKRTFGGICGEYANHDGPCIRDEEDA